MSDSSPVLQSLHDRPLAVLKLKKQNPSFVSPSDNFQTPVSKKLAASKKQRFATIAKPFQLLPLLNQEIDDQDEDSDANPTSVAPAVQPGPNTSTMQVDNDDNPF